MVVGVHTWAVGGNPRPLSFELNELLPPSYASKLEAESESMLRRTLDGLRDAVAVGDLHRGARYHTAALKRYMGYKYELGDAERAECIHILYDLVTAEVEVELTLRVRWCSVLAFLLRRAKHMSLKLPWRPMFDCIMKHTRSKLRAAAFVNRGILQSHSHSLARAAAQCRRHFPAGTSAELLAAIEPMLCPKDPQLYMGAALLSLLAPTHSNEAATFLPRVLTLWQHSGVESSLEWEMLFLILLKRLAKDIFNGRATPIDWDPLLETIFGRTLLILSLPGGAGQVCPVDSVLKESPHPE
jgi:hypothetical protein